MPLRKEASSIHPTRTHMALSPFWGTWQWGWRSMPKETILPLGILTSNLMVKSPWPYPLSHNTSYQWKCKVGLFFFCFRSVRCITHINKIIFQGCIKHINGIIFQNTPMKYFCFYSCVALPNLAGWVLIVECECLLMEEQPHGAGITKSILGVGCNDGWVWG